MPEFAERRDERAAAKQARLGDAAQRALARREPPRAADPAYAFGATEAPAVVPAAPAPSRPARGAKLRKALEARGEQAFSTYVGRATDRRLERTVGSALGLRTIFTAMTARFDPEGTGGFTGDIQYDLRAADGSVRPWTITIGERHATARPGASDDAKVKVKVSVADFSRIAARRLDPVKALLGGQLDLEGDFAVASRLGEMFGEPSQF
jgi:putative sterol carrier protein